MPLGRTRVRPPALETAQLDVDVCLLIEKLGCDICPVRPSNRSVFSDLETSEILNVFERLEDGPPELGAEVYFSFASVFEPYPDGVVSNVTCFDDAVVHGLLQRRNRIELLSTFHVLPR